MSKQNKQKIGAGALPTKWTSAFENNVAYQHYYMQLMNVALNRYEWKNLPDGIDPRFIEMCLMNNGYCLFFKDDIAEKFAVMQCTIGGRLNPYYVPTMRKAYAPNGYFANYTDNDSVIIFNNYLRMGDVGNIQYYAEKLYSIDRSIDVNIALQKYPAIVSCEESQRLTMENLFMKYQGNVPFIFANKNLDLTGVNVINMNVPFISDNLYELKRKYWYEALTLLGIENSNTEKKAREITDEVQANNSITNMQKLTGLDARKDAVDKINAMFNLDIDVQYRNLRVDDLDFTLMGDELLDVSVHNSSSLDG